VQHSLPQDDDAGGQYSVRLVSQQTTGLPQESVLLTQRQLWQELQQHWA